MGNALNPATGAPTTAPPIAPPIAPPVVIDWDAIDTVFLDMDGTLLDLRFDNHFWLEHVPLRYAEAHGLSLDGARERVLPRYRQVQGTLAWYCVDHWSRELGLDIALLKAEVAHLIAVHPGVIEFLEALAARGKRRVLVTNAHQHSIDIKLRHTPLGDHLERVISAHDLQQPKEAAGFRARLAAIEPFDPRRTLFIDDNLDVLRAARAHGFTWLLAITNPDSAHPPRQIDEFPAIDGFAPLIPALREIPRSDRTDNR